MDTDLSARRQSIERARSRFGTDDALGELDPQVHESWARCAPTIATAQDAVPVDGDDVDELWQASPIRRAVPDLVEQLQAVASDGDFVAAITDPTGRILWSWGGTSMRNRAESVNFVAGGRWDERSAGTNALALALIERRPSVVFSSEHWCSAVHDWVCYSAPVFGPDDEPLGVIDLSTSWQRATPLALTTVSTLARLVQVELRRVATSPDVTVADGAPVDVHELRLRLMGHGAASLDETSLLLSRRQLEILAVLAAEPGLGLDELQAHIYGDHFVSHATVRAEVSHLRTILGGAIANRRYRLTISVQVDLLELERCIRSGDLAGAIELYGAQLLPESEAPWIIDRRHRSDVALRNALLGAGTGAELLSFADVHPSDFEVLTVAIERIPPGDPLGPLADARLTIAQRS